MVMAETTPTPEALCRDCLKATAGAARRCRHCGSPRLLRHDELHSLSIAHIDCDAFYAAVEKRYVSDQLWLQMRSGPGNEFRILKTLSSGTHLIYLEMTENKKYTKLLR